MGLSSVSVSANDKEMLIFAFGVNRENNTPYGAWANATGDSVPITYLSNTTAPSVAKRIQWTTTFSQYWKITVTAGMSGLYKICKNSDFRGTGNEWEDTDERRASAGEEIVEVSPKTAGIYCIIAM